MHSSLVCAAIIPVRFNPANYSVKEGVDGNAVIFLEGLEDQDFSFTVTVRSQDGTAIGEFCLYLFTYCITLSCNCTIFIILHSVLACWFIWTLLTTQEHSHSRLSYLCSCKFYNRQLHIYMNLISAMHGP